MPSNNQDQTDDFSIIGVWDNNETGFKKGSIIFYEHQRGMIYGGGVSAIYFSWNMD